MIDSRSSSGRMFRARHERRRHLSLNPDGWAQKTRHRMPGFPDGLAVDTAAG